MVTDAIENRRMRMLVSIAIVPAILLLGLFAVYASPRDIPFLLVFVCALVVVGFVAITVISAMMGKVWAIGVYTALSVFLIDASFRQREFTDATIDWQTLLKLMVWGGALLNGITHWNDARSLFRENALPWMLVYAVLALISTSYSIIPTYSFGAAFALLSFLLFSVAVVTRLDERQIIYSLLVGLGIGLLAAFLLYFVAPERAIAVMEGGNVFRLAGLSGSPNNLGRIAALFVFFLVLLPIRGYWKWSDWRFFVLLALALFILSQTQSRTAFVAVGIALAYIWMRIRPRQFVVVVVIAVILLLGMLLGGESFIKPLAMQLTRSGYLSEITTLTGRTDIWLFNWQQFLQAPWFGHGYGSTKLLMPVYYHTAYGWTSTSAHNMLLQSLVTLGVVGTLFLIIALFKQLTCMAAFRPLHDGIFIFVVISGLLEAGAIGPAPNVLTLTWLVSIAWVARQVQCEFEKDRSLLAKPLRLTVSTT